MWTNYQLTKAIKCLEQQIANAYENYQWHGCAARMWEAKSYSWYEYHRKERDYWYNQHKHLQKRLDAANRALNNN